MSSFCPLACTEQPEAFNPLLLRFGFHRMANVSGWVDDSKPQVFLNHPSLVWQLLELALRAQRDRLFLGRNNIPSRQGDRYILGTQTTTADRRTAVYGATKEVEIVGKQFQPAREPAHPEAPDTAADNGYEGQGMNIAVIDTGVDWRHPIVWRDGHDVSTIATAPLRATGELK